MDLDGVHRRLRQIAKLCNEYRPDHKPTVFEGSPTEFRGYSEAEIKLAVCKKCPTVAFATDQAMFMEYLGICPEIYAVRAEYYCMEFLHPVEHNVDSLQMQEKILYHNVWTRMPEWIQENELAWRDHLRKSIKIEVPDWALEKKCVIHGDPTLDNVLIDRKGGLRITDPIPPQYLGKPSIMPVDHGKILQSFLGWEVVLRGMEPIEYAWPLFMKHPSLACRAIFWAMVAIKRIAYRDMSDGITQWAKQVAKELEELCK